MAVGRGASSDQARNTDLFRSSSHLHHSWRVPDTILHDVFFVVFAHSTRFFNFFFMFRFPPPPNWIMPEQIRFSNKC